MLCLWSRPKPCAISAVPHGGLDDKQFISDDDGKYVRSAYSWP